jgi:hypothetical protein
MQDKGELGSLPFGTKLVSIYLAKGVPQFLTKPCLCRCFFHVRSEDSYEAVRPRRIYLGELLPNLFNKLVASVCLKITVGHDSLPRTQPRSICGPCIPADAEAESYERGRIRLAAMAFGALGKTSPTTRSSFRAVTPLLCAAPADVDRRRLRRIVKAVDQHRRAANPEVWHTPSGAGSPQASWQPNSNRGPAR